MCDDVAGECKDLKYLHTARAGLVVWEEDCYVLMD